MPIPKPKAGESESDFMSRCMSNDAMQAEHPDRDQRVAVCLSSFRPKKEEPEMSDLETLEVEETKFEDGTLDVQAEIKAMPDEEESGVFSGYGSIFGNKDLGNDVVVQGAFAKSIASRGAKGVKLLYQHKADEPIGVFDEIIEDKRGLRVKGRLAMGTQRGREVYELMKMGALDGLSIGFRVDTKGYDYDERGKRRMLKEVDLLEISAVTFPMNPRARVAQVKGADRTVREWEELLRDAANLSRSEAKVAAGAVAKALDLREAGDTEKPEMIDALSRLTSILKS
jgi:HK97 family phage prohead protease